ncbi:MAG: Rrf2 family transcriptional regulator [Syntrophorhabdaceae bacterium]|nr:Rrf2 family transcriptional regulator [Syntrophorhabdaceae bacterium]
MYITRKADYGVRCVLLLSMDGDKGANVTEIAEKMDIPKPFLAKIVQKLVKAGILKSLRGIKGGFQLAKDPKDISLFDVIEAIDGPPGMNRCAIDKKACSLSDRCPVHPVWVELRFSVEDTLKNVSFKELIERNV